MPRMCGRRRRRPWDATPGPSRLTRSTSKSETEDLTVPQKGWSDKRERQYEHIKDRYEVRGVSEDEAEERAARTVNKERREAGETKAPPIRR